MSWRFFLKGGGIRYASLLAILLVISMFYAIPVKAQGGFALSGSFYRQSFEIPQGSSVSGPSIYVVVFNHSDEELEVKMTTEAPVGVNIIFSDDEFTLPPGEQQKVLIGVEVTYDADPGEYEVSVTGESYRKGVTGIQLTGAASQSAKLVVLGESASILVQVLNPKGEPIAAIVRLYKVVDSQSYEVAFSETGILKKMIAPGDYTAATYVGGEKIAEEDFTIASGDEKTVTLTAATVYFEGFGIVPNYHRDTSELAFAQIVYTVRNLYQPVDKAEIILEISRGGDPLEELSLAYLNPLDVGRVGLNYNYIPTGGWVNGNYGFRLRLNLDDKPYSNTVEEQLNVSDVKITDEETSQNIDTGGGISPAVIGGIIAGILVVVGGSCFLIWRRRRA